MSDAGGEEVWELLGLGSSLSPEGPLPSNVIREDSVKDAIDELQNALSSQLEISSFDDHANRKFERVSGEAAQLYEREQESLVRLEKQAQSHEEKLSEVANEVGKIVDRLEGVSCEVERLRTETEFLSNKISAYLTTEDCLSAYVDSVLLSPALVRHIVDGPVGNAEYVEYLKELRTKIARFELEDTREAAFYKELKAILGKVVIRAVYKVTQFLLSKIQLLQVPNTNIHIVKETSLLKHRFLMEFLRDVSPKAFAHVRSMYVTIMSQLYEVLFQRYATGLLTLKNKDTAGFVIGAANEQVYWNSAETAKQISYKNSSTQGRGGNDSIEARLENLSKPNASAIVLPVAEANNERFLFEEIHRSLGKMLTDTCTTEHRFCSHFFGDKQGKMFGIFFKRIVDMLVKIVFDHISSSKDAIGALLCSKITEAQRNEMQKRDIPTLFDYFIRVDVLLKPRFKVLFDENLNSVLAAKKDANRLFRGENETRPYAITRRFAQFSSAILVLCSFGAPDKTLVQSTARLRTAFNDLLGRVSTLYKKPRSRITFLVNNFDIILTTYGSCHLQSTADYSFFSSLLTAQIATYVELELSSHFPDLQTLLRSTKLQKSRHPERKVRAVLQEFSRNWQIALAHMEEGILQSFPNFILGDEVLKAIRSAILALYKQTETFVEAHHSELRSELVKRSDLLDKVTKTGRIKT